MGSAGFITFTAPSSLSKRCAAEPVTASRVGLDIPREIDKLTDLPTRKAASNMDVEGWSGDLSHTIP